MLNVLAAGAMALSSLTVQAPVVTNPPDAVAIDVVTANGSGCHGGTAAVAVSPDKTAFTVTYSSYLAQTGLGTKPTDFRKNCQLNLNVHFPQGFTYAVSEADYRGYAHLATGAYGSQTASYYFQGDATTSRMAHTFSGPLDNDWQTKDSIGVAALVFEPCGARRNLNVNTELRVNAGTSNPRRTTSFLTMDSSDGSFSTLYHLAWKHC